MFQLNTHNRFPDCFKLQIAAVSPNVPQHHHLNLTLRFGEQWQALQQGRIKWGLKGGELHLKLDSPGLKLRDRPQTFTETLSPTDIPLLLDPPSDEPTWEIFTPSAYPILQGEILLSPWVVLHQDAPPQDLQARFTVKPHHVYLTDAENLWPHSISPNQHAVLDRAIVNFLMEYEFAAPLSLITLASQNPVFNHPSASTAASDHLQGQIERITSAQPDNFLALAKAAHLDPKTDFAGGNLRGTELNNLDFGSANLVGVNFRGAELCDCDLSAAQLQQANLRGADLSGAYLANANLRYSDLQRASLALANLADADLRGANLSQTNLSQTNLSHAAVSGAYFGENVGLSQEMAANLQERGGIFL